MAHFLPLEWMMTRVQASAASSLAAADGFMRQLENDGKTAVIVTVEGEAVGVIAVADVDKEVGYFFFHVYFFVLARC